MNNWLINWPRLILLALFFFCMYWVSQAAIWVVGAYGWWIAYPITAVMIGIGYLIDLRDRARAEQERELEDWQNLLERERQSSRYSERFERYEEDERP